MMNSPGLHASTLLAPALSPRLQRAVRMLQMSSLDFSQLVRQALDANPFLESDDAQGPQDEDTSGIDTDLDEGDPAHDDEAAAGWDPDPLVRRRESGEEEGGAWDTLVVPTTLADHLATQLNVMPLPERDRTLALALAHCLDDDGYLRMALAEAGAAAGLDPPADEQELSIALRRVQALEPAGVGARDVAECLLLQMTQRPGASVQLARTIVRHHLQDLASKDAGVLARRLGLSLEAVRAAREVIRRLDPRPGWRFGAQAAHYVTPDVIVRRRHGQWVATLNPAVIPRVRLNRRYADLFNRYREAGHAELGAHLQEARWTVRNVEQRFSTILAVARAILQRQHRFLALGTMAMRPLALREIADAVGVHESTVSRVTNNKYMATPCGVFELKYFFSRGLATASGGACSPTAIRTVIRELIAAEPPGQALSDVALAQALATQGLQVARRTVTKYRQQLRIAPAARRHPGIR